MPTYADILDQKARRWSGFGLPTAATADLPPALYDWQALIVRWALRKGRAAIFADTGLGKTAMQLAWGQAVSHALGRPVLVLTPLAVIPQTIREGARFGCPVRRMGEGDGGLVITNYEQLHHVDPTRYAGVVLDESSLLKSYMGVTKQRLLAMFAQTPYRLCCSATPAPNDHLELGNHCEFLGVMSSHEMIARWFINDPMEAGGYRVKAHGASDFWRWVASWAAAMTSPADWGYAADGYVLPELSIRTEDIGPSDIEPPPGHLFVTAANSATSLHQSLRASSRSRAIRAANLVGDDPEESWLIWAHTNYDADAFRALCPAAIEVRGDHAPSEKAARLDAFARGEIQILVTKPEIAGFGLNWQHCARVIFLGPSYSYEQWYQAIRRTWRYGQKRPVKVWLLSASEDYAVVNTVRQKEAAHRHLQQELLMASQQEICSPADALAESEGLGQTWQGDNWTLVRADCVTALESQPTASVGLSVFSPPFANLYMYSPAREDMGNCGDYEEFFESYQYLAAQLLRVTIPGRLCAIHCKDLPLYKGRDGAAGLFDFPGKLIASMTAAGWTYHSRVTIWKDPVLEMQRTKNHGLLYKQLRKDSCASRMGMADYVLAFRKWDGAIFPDPVPHTRDDFPLDQWQAWASPVWDDIQQTRVLQYQDAKADEDERHICPLQLDVIERCLTLWSHPGDLVLSPFAGIGSEGFEAVRLGRRFLGYELKAKYAAVAAENLRLAAEQATQGSLLALMAE